MFFLSLFCGIKDNIEICYADNQEMNQITGSFNESVIYDVPTISQANLFLNGIETGVGCVPASIEMILRWWHQKNPDYPVLSAQNLIDRNAAQNLYQAGKGMTFSAAEDELDEAGYQMNIELNSNKEDLILALKKFGPLGVQIKTNWIPTTMNHVGVLTAYNAETDSITVNDPFYGRAVSWSWDSFDGIWSLNYAYHPEKGEIFRRIFFYIVPKDLLKTLLPEFGIDNTQSNSPIF